MNAFILYIYNIIKFLIPETRGFGLKRWMLNRAGAEIAKGVKICSSVKILGAGKLIVGENTWIGHEVMINCSSTVNIGSNVDIAPRVFIGTGTHEINIDGGRIAGRGLNKDVSIGDNCWICAGSMILPGITVGKASLVAAGAVVTSNIESGLLVGGIPARIIKQL